MSLKDNRYSPLYRPGQAFREAEGRLPAVAMSFLALGALGGLLLVGGSGVVRAIGSVLFLLGLVIGGGGYTAVQVRALLRRASSRDDDRPPSDR